MVELVPVVATADNTGKGQFWSDPGTSETVDISVLYVDIESHYQ